MPMSQGEIVTSLLFLLYIYLYGIYLPKKLQLKKVICNISIFFFIFFICVNLLTYFLSQVISSHTTWGLIGLLSCRFILITIMVSYFLSGGAVLFSLSPALFNRKGTKEIVPIKIEERYRRWHSSFRKHWYWLFIASAWFIILLVYIYVKISKITEI